MGRTRPGKDLFDVCVAEAIRLEDERWIAGLGGITSQEVFSSLRGKGNPLLTEYESNGGTHKWTGAIFVSASTRGQWQKYGIRSMGSEDRNTRQSTRTVWWRFDRPLAEIRKRSGRTGSAPVSPSVAKRPTDQELRKAIVSLHSSVAWARVMGFEPQDPVAVRKFMEWIRGMCGGDQW